MTQTNHHCSHQTPLSKAEPKNLPYVMKKETEKETIIDIIQQEQVNTQLDK